MALILYAPNVHSGGGRVLLEALYDNCGSRFDQAILDLRLSRVSNAFSQVSSKLVRNSVSSRLAAEWHLRRVANPGDTILCLHSLPPLFAVRANVVVLLQNRLVIERDTLDGYPIKTCARITVERLWARLLQKRCSRYIVQTPSMAVAVKSWLRNPTPISVIPFANPAYSQADNTHQTKKFDFVYVASGESHKNHVNLLSAWRLLAEAGIKPILALTVDANVYPALARNITRHADALGVNVVNLGTLSATEVARTYRESSALIFPSIIESFGLPLIEATQLGLPVIASELDYVRDVIEPVETFDPTSPISIARAIRRFLDCREMPVSICSGDAFLAEVLA